MKIALIHLSDIHIQNASCPILQRAEKICATVNPLLPDVQGVIVAVSGDIAYAGTAQEYELARIFFDQIMSYLSERVCENVPVYLVTVPGNHDGTFKFSTGARNGLIGAIRAEQDVDSSVIQVITEPQEHYFTFEDSLPNHYRTFSDALWKQHVITIGDKTIAINAINVSWMSQVPEKPGTLFFPTTPYLDVAKTPADLRIALIHHPLNWYCQTTYHPFRELCRSQFEIVMSGHEHSGSSYITKDLELGESLSLEAGALWPHEQDKASEFSVITLDLSTQRFAREHFQWKSSRYEAAQGAAVWDSFVALPKQKNQDFIIQPDFRRKLEDVGATFTHPNKEKLVLSDIFVYPELSEIDPIERPVETVSSKILASQIVKIGRAILRGDDQFGKTSLLHTLFMNYLSAGYIPLLLSGKEFASASTDEQLQRRLLAAVDEQYGKDAQSLFSQLDRQNKVLLVDDLDTASAHPDVVPRALTYISRHFDYAVVTVSDRFDFAEATSKKTLEATKEFSSYRFNGFGFKLRGDLIAKWMSVGQQLGVSELESRVHSAEQTINAVIGKGLVATTAFNILVLLQSMEINSKGALANAGMAQYYEFLIRRSLFQAKLKAEQFDEIFSYISCLAWFFTERKAKSLDLSDLRQFNADFSDRILETDFSQRIDFLRRCRILEVMGSSYSFRYPYIRYFFTAKYISDHLDEDTSLRDRVVHACRHLYLKENANIILFLTHHASNKWIIREIEQTLMLLLSGIEPLNLAAHTQMLNGWVTQTAKLFVDTSDIGKNREKQRAAADKASAREEIEVSKEVGSMSDLDFISQINLLFKTCEILGQILKNKYGSLEKGLKNELMSQLFEGPLRGINFFLQIVNEDPQALLSELSKTFRERSPSLSAEDAEKIAQRLIFVALGAISEQFLSRQGEIIGAPTLKSTIDEIAHKAGNVTHRMVAIAAQLSYPGDPPFSAIEETADELKDNVFGYRLLQGIVSRHLYMFSLPYDQRQRLADAAGVGVREHNSIAFRSADAKKVTGRPHQPQNTAGLMSKLQQSFLLRNKAVTDKVLERMKKNTNK